MRSQDINDEHSRMSSGRMSDKEIDRHLAELDKLAATIGKRWPKGVSAVDAVRDVRRDLGNDTKEDPMSQVGIKEFKTHASEIFRRVRDNGEVVDVTYRGEIIARISPVQTERRPTKEEIKRHFAAFDELAAEIAKHTPPGLSAEDVINDIRREL